MEKPLILLWLSRTCFDSSQGIIKKLYNKSSIKVQYYMYDQITYAYTIQKYKQLKI